MTTNGGISQHFYTRLNASKIARIESKVERILRDIVSPKLGKMDVFLYIMCFCITRRRSLSVLSGRHGRSREKISSETQQHQLQPDQTESPPSSAPTGPPISVYLSRDDVRLVPPTAADVPAAASMETPSPPLR